MGPWIAHLVTKLLPQPLSNDPRLRPQSFLWKLS